MLMYVIMPDFDVEGAGALAVVVDCLAAREFDDSLVVFVLLFFFFLRFFLLVTLVVASDTVVSDDLAETFEAM